jgi:hypothetical protein
MDVLTLDLKIENFNLLLMQGVKLGQGELFTGGDTAAKKPEDGSTAAKDTTSILGRSRNDPIPLRMLTEQERSNFSNLGANAKSDGEATPQQVSQQYTQNLSDFYNLSGQAKMTVRGNPDLLARCTFGFIPQHVSAVTITSAKANSETNEGVKEKWRTDLMDRLSKQIDGTSIAQSPMFVKVNVYGPNVDFMTLDPIDSNENFTKQLLTDNFYWCGMIKTKIEGAHFTQELELNKFSVFGASSKSNAAPATQTGATLK